jgi:hypothetical protein
MSWSQSYGFRIYNYSASVVEQARKKTFFLIPKTLHAICCVVKVYHVVGMAPVISNPECMYLGTNDPGRKFRTKC